jgi:hypothetical protein
MLLLFKYVIDQTVPTDINNWVKRKSHLIRDFDPLVDAQSICNILWSLQDEPSRKIGFW